MAKRFPLVVDTENNNRIIELPIDDCLDLTGSDICSVENITVTGTITLPTGPVTSFTGNYSDLIDPPSLPERIIDLVGLDGTAGQVLKTDGNGGTYFGDITIAYSDVTGTPEQITSITDLNIADGDPGTFLTTNGEGIFTFQSISDVNVDLGNFSLENNVISVTNINGDIILQPSGAGFVNIDSVTGLKVPVGSTLQRSPNQQGVIRFNSDLGVFEGYNGAGWASLGGVRSLDGETYIKAETTPGAGDDVLAFFTDGVERLEITDNEVNFSDTVTVNIDTLSVTNLQLEQSLDLSGDITIGDSETDTFTLYANIAGNLIPKVHDTYDIGSKEKQWQNLYVADRAIINGYEFPSADAEIKSFLGTSATGQLEWMHPDRWGGNRVYVSAEYGDDNNDGVTAPVRTVKKGLQIAGGMVFEPVNKDQFVEYETSILRNAKQDIADATIKWIADTYGFTFGYDSIKCRRDMDLIIDAILLDDVLGTNFNSITAGKAYQRANSSYVTGTQNLVTLGALDQLKIELSNYDLYTSTLNNLQDSISEIADIFTNGLSAANAFSFAPPPELPTPASEEAKFKLINNISFIQAEILAWLNANYPALVYDHTKCSRDVEYIIDGLCHDITYGGNFASITSAKSYFVGTQGQLGAGEITATVEAYRHMQNIVSAVVQGIEITPSPLNAAIQVTSGGLATITEAVKLKNLIQLIIDVIEAENVNAIDRTILPNFSWSDIRKKDSYYKVKREQDEIKNNVINYINTTNGFYDSIKCHRDVMEIVDSVTYDLRYGGNSRTVTAGESYYDANNELYIGQSQKVETIAAIEYARDLALTYVTGANATAIEASMNLIASILDDRGNAPAKIFGNAKPKTVTVMVATGDYVEDNPMIIPDNVSIIGDNLRRSIIRPKNANRDLLRVRNAVYMTGLVFRDHVDSSGVPDFTFRYGISFDNPSDTATSRAGYIDLPASRPLIFTSPYIQNVSVISFLGAGGTEIDGNLVDVPNTPPNAIEAENPVDLTDGIPEQGKSMVANAYTILSFGGNAWRVMNDAYAQIVSCFVIFCENGCLTQNGGYLSITNSASNFGLFSLRSTGYSPNSFTYDRGYIFETYILEGYQVFKVCNLKRAALEHYVIRIKTNDGSIDVTNDYTKNGRSELEKTLGFFPSSTSVIGNQIIFPAAEFDGTAVDSLSDRITFTEPHPFHTNNVVEYSANGNPVIGGLGDGGTYLVQVLDATTIRLYTPGPNNTKVLLDLTSASTGVHSLQLQHDLLSGDHIEYDSQGDTEIVGLLHELKYYVEYVNEYTIRLYHDEDLEKPVRPLDPSVCQNFHAFTIGFEYIFVEEVVSTHNVYQEWTLPATVDDGGGNQVAPGYNVILGNRLTCTKSNGQIIQIGLSGWDPVNRILTVSIELSVDGTNILRIVGDSGTIIPGNLISNTPYEITVQAAAPVENLFTSEFKILTTENTGIEALASLQTQQIHLHRPSICNSSAHTWEFAGSGTDYNALPQNGGLTDEFFEQVSTAPGRVYSSGTNEIGDFKVGNFVRAYNRTGNIDFKNKVNIGELDSLALSLSSGIVVTSISGDIELGETEDGGPSNSRLITQLAIYTFLNNRLGDFIDKKVSTNAIPSSVVQLNSAGLINSDLIPPTGNFTAYIVNYFKGRLELHEDIPVVDLKAGDIVIEEYDEITITTNFPVTIQEGEVIEQFVVDQQANITVLASGIAKFDYAAQTEIKLIEPFISTFAAGDSTKILRGSVSGDLLDNNNPAEGVYPNIVTTVAEVRENYFITTSRAKQYLITLSSDTYDFTGIIQNQTPIQGAISGAIATVDEYREGVLTQVDIINGLPGGVDYVEGNYVNVQVLYSPNSTGQNLGLFALADVTVSGTGQITTFDLKRGGYGYEIGELVTVATQLSDVTIDGATYISKSGVGADFEIEISNVEDRLYVTLNQNAGLEFTATNTNIDFIVDDSIDSLSITLDAPTVQIGFLGNNVDTTTYILTTTGAHNLSNGDRVVYQVNTNTPINGLEIAKTYYVKVISALELQLFDNYALNGLPIPLLSTNSNGNPHLLELDTVNLEKNSFYAFDHGYQGGEAVQLSAVDPPLGLNDNGFYFIGSVTDNTFTLHVARGSAIDSVNGLTSAEVPITDTGTGTLTLRKQTVIIVGDANTSGQLETSWSNLTTTTIDAKNIISGIINTARLGTGNANDLKFLRGDNSWQYAVAGIKNTTIGDPITLTGPNEFDGQNYVYYGDIDIKVEPTGYLNVTPLTNEATLGVAGFAVEHFIVTAGIVEARPSTLNGQIDALTLGGQDGNYYRNPRNLTIPVPIEKGGTNLSSYVKGDIIYAGTDLPGSGNPFEGSLSKLSIGSQNDVMVVSSNGTPSWTNNLILNGATIDAIQIGITGPNVIDTVTAVLPDEPWDLILNSDSGTTRVNDNLIVEGDLTVSGTTTTINSTTITIDDPIFTLGGDTAPESNDNKDRGIEFRYYSDDDTTAKVGFFGYDISTGYLTFIPDATNNSEIFSGTAGDIEASNFRGALIGNADTASKWQTARTITFQNYVNPDSGAITYTDVTGSITLDGTEDVNVVLNFAIEQFQDKVGAMVQGSDSAQNGITVTYDDTNGKLDFDVADFTLTFSGDVTGTKTITNLGSVDIDLSMANNSVDLGTHTTGDFADRIKLGNGLIVNTNATPIAITDAINSYYYEIVTTGDTTWADFDANATDPPGSYNVGDRFIMANGPGLGTGTVKPLDSGEQTTYTISHADTSTAQSITNTGNAVIQSFNLDDFGHITSYSSKTIDTYSGWNVQVGSTYSQTLLETNSVRFLAGTNISISGANNTTDSTIKEITVNSTTVYPTDLTYTGSTLTLTLSDSNTLSATISGFLTSYSETDTLTSVTTRGNTTTNDITAGNLRSKKASPFIVIESTDVMDTESEGNGALQWEKATSSSTKVSTAEIKVDNTLISSNIHSAMKFYTRGASGLILGMELDGNTLYPKANEDGNLGSTGRKWNNVYSTAFTGTATSARYADLAEMYVADKHYAPGTVMIFGGEKEVTASTEFGSTKIIGVVSSKPAYLMNSELENGTAIALKGRVPCLVVGKVEKGDMLTASDIAGVAIVSKEFIGGAILGKAIESSDNTEIKVIEIAVGI